MPKWIPERPAYKPERRTVGFVALAAFLLMLLLRLFSKKLPFYGNVWLISLFLTVVALLVPTLFYCLYRGKGYTRALRLQKLRGAHIPLLAAAFFALLSGALLLSVLTGGTDTLSTTVSLLDRSPDDTLLKNLASLFALAVLPAIAEELLFRGVITVEYERRGAVRAILMSALLFALLHFDLSNLLTHLFVGTLFSLVLYATNSLIATMILHVLYSGTMLFTLRYLSALYRFTGTVQLFLFLVIFVFLVSLILFCRFAVQIYRTRDEQGIKDPRRAVPYNVQFYTVLDALGDPTVIICAVAAIAGFILF